MPNELDLETIPFVVEAMDNLALLTDIAIGDYSDAKEVYERYNLTEKDWKVLEKSKAFQAAVLQVRSELEKDGRMSRYKARMMADDLMDVVYREAMDEGNALPIEKRLETLKVLARLGDMEPKNTLGSKGSTGPQFSIQINLPSTPASAGKVEIVEAKLVEADNG